MKLFQYFWMEGNDLPEGIGFGLFSVQHFGTMAGCAVGIFLLLRAFLRRTAAQQLRWLRVLAVLLLAGNLARDVFLLVKGRMSVAYLPFHLCSFAIFVYLLYAFLPEKYAGSGNRGIILQPRFREALGEIGVVLLLPGTIMALIFPDWSAYPLLNFMCIHSFLWHAVLAACPLALFLSRRVHPTIRHLWYPVLYLAILVPPTLWFDRRFDVNFLFINWPLPNTPLMPIYNAMGKYWLVGYALLVFAVLVGEYAAIETVKKCHHADQEADTG